jgi:hypothetical protein
VQQKESGKLNRELHFQELHCWRAECSLTSVTLNSCRPSPASNGKAPPLVVERSSTREGNLEVTNEGNTLVRVETGSDLVLLAGAVERLGAALIRLLPRA